MTASARHPAGAAGCAPAAKTGAGGPAHCPVARHRTGQWALASQRETGGGLHRPNRGGVTSERCPVGTNIPTEIGISRQSCGPGRAPDAHHWQRTGIAARSSPPGPPEPRNRGTTATRRGLQAAIARPARRLSRRRPRQCVAGYFGGIRAA